MFLGMIFPILEHCTRANMMPVIAEKMKSIIGDLGENSNRAGLVDTPRRAAQALLFFTKGYEDR